MSYAKPAPKQKNGTDTRSKGHSTRPTWIRPKPEPRELPKLEVGDLNSPLEREANTVAEQVLRMPTAGPTERRTSSPKGADDLELIIPESAAHRRSYAPSGADDTVMLKRVAGPHGETTSINFNNRTRDQVHFGAQTLSGQNSFQDSQSLETRLRNAQGGSPLPESARNFLELRLQTKLDSVRVHTSASAGSLARDLHARAFARGQDIYFAPGEFRPNSVSGMRLLTHEVVHTVQNKDAGRDANRSAIRRSPPTNHDEPNSRYKELLQIQTSLDLDKDARNIINEAQHAINRVFNADSEGFFERMESLNKLLSKMQIRLANAEDLDQRFMRVREADLMPASDYKKLADAEVARLAAYDRAFGPDRGIGFWLWPTQYKNRLLVGVYDREGKLPSASRDSAGIGEWIDWLTEREVELADLLERADEILSWGSELSVVLPEQEPLASSAYALAAGIPAALARSGGREYQYLTELMRDRLPAWFVDHFTRDLTSLRIETEALDSGISVARLRELDELIASCEKELVELRIAAAEGFRRKLDESLDQQLQAFIALPKNDRTYAFHRLRANEQWGDLVSAASEDTLEQLETAGDEIGIKHLGTEGFETSYSVGNMTWDMAKATPGGTLNVGYGMIISLPIVGDMIDRAVGDHVSNFSDTMNKSLGIDDHWSKTQREVGQTFGKVAGTIGFAGVAGVGAGNVDVFGKTLSLSANVRHTALGADLLHNGWRVVTGRSTAGEKLSKRDRVLSGVGFVISGLGGRAGKGAESSRQTFSAKDADLTLEIAIKKAKKSIGTTLTPDQQKVFDEVEKGTRAAHESLKKAETFESRVAKTGVVVGSSGGAADLWNYVFGDTE